MSLLALKSQLMTYNCSSAQLSIPSWYPGESTYGTKIDEKINCLLESKMDVTISAGRFAVSALFVLVTAVIFLQVEKFQHTPYMDEIFHVPQAQKYCAGNFTEVIILIAMCKMWSLLQFSLYCHHSLCTTALTLGQDLAGNTFYNFKVTLLA